MKLATMYFLRFIKAPVSCGDCSFGDEGARTDAERDHKNKGRTSPDREPGIRGNLARLCTPQLKLREDNLDCRLCQAPTLSPTLLATLLVCSGVNERSRESDNLGERVRVTPV